MLVSVVLAVVGLIFGSFVGASVWRIRAQQLRTDAKGGEKVPKRDIHQVEKISTKSLKSDRSVCLHCGHQLKWNDLIPLVSWVTLKGKCRYCKAKIGWFEPAIELAMAVFFVVSFLFWPYQLGSLFSFVQLGIWLIAGVGLAMLFVYDMRWYLLPNKIVYPLIGLGLVNSLLALAHNGFAVSEIASVVLGCTILAGLYYFIYVFSRHEWVGFGDVKLGLVLALLLVDWKLSALALFMANFIGTVIYIPLMLRGSVKRHTHIPFGPLLISGWFIAGIFGTTIISAYLSLTLGTL